MNMRKLSKRDDRAPDGCIFRAELDELVPCCQPIAA